MTGVHRRLLRFQSQRACQETEQASQSCRFSTQRFTSTISVEKGGGAAFTVWDVSDAEADVAAPTELIRAVRPCAIVRCRAPIDLCQRTLVRLQPTWLTAGSTDLLAGMASLDWLVAEEEEEEMGRCCCRKEEERVRDRVRGRGPLARGHRHGTCQIVRRMITRTRGER